MGPYTLFAIGAGYSLDRAYDNIYIVLSVGTIAVFIGAQAGALIAFSIGRFFCREKVRTYTQKNRVLKAIDSTVETQGLKLIILLRLSLLVPFNFSNYVFGGSSVKIFDFIIGSLGLFPLVLFFVYLGSTMSNI